MKFRDFIKIDIKLTRKILKLEKKILKIIEEISLTLKSKKKIFICGNGGSAADAEHLSAEFLVRLRPKINRVSLPVISLTQGTSVLTACGNDYGFQNVFKRTLDGLGNQKDLLICLSTSGNSKNIFNVIKLAKRKKIKTIGFFGQKKGLCHGLADFEIIIPSNDVAKIQESYMKLCHYIFARVEDNLLK